MLPVCLVVISSEHSGRLSRVAQKYCFLKVATLVKALESSRRDLAIWHGFRACLKHKGKVWIFILSGGETEKQKPNSWKNSVKLWSLEL